MSLASASLEGGFVWALLLSAAACSNMAKPGPEGVVGMSHTGAVSLTEIIAVGAAVGKGVLNFQGKSYPFKLAGGVTGSGGASNMEASGEVYNLHSVSDFHGLYTQSSGAAGLDNSKASDLRLRNKAGAVMHVTGTQSGHEVELWSRGDPD